MTLTTQPHLKVKNDLILFVGKLNVTYIEIHFLKGRLKFHQKCIRIYKNIRVRVVLKSEDPQDNDKNFASLLFTKHNKLINLYSQY